MNYGKLVGTMPVNSCSENGNPGFKWGDSGKCYIYEKNNPKSMGEAKRKATIQGLATGEYVNKEDSTELVLEETFKSLKEWFKERWVDLSRPKSGGGFEPCGRSDASTGKYPKCVPASRAARMTPEEIASAIRRKRTAESTQTRDGKKPIYVSTDKEKVEKANVPTDPELYARVKAEAKAKFDVYPSAYANAWLVREYKKRGGGYRVTNKSLDMSKAAGNLTEEEATLADALTAVARMYGKFNEDETGIWAGYESAEENEVKDIGVKCSNCVLYEGNGVCKIIAQQVENEGKCRFAVIPDGVVQMKEPQMSEETETEKTEKEINGYPAATQDISINIRNRQECIDVANYGPMNPMLPNDDYWQARADVYNTSIEEARTSRCSNCAAFVQTTDMMEAIAQGLGGEDEAYAVVKIANLGYCEIFDFKCAGNRTCDAWVTGGPLTDSNMEVEKNYYDIISIARDMLKNKEK